MDTLIYILLFPFIFVVWIIPILIIALSSRTRGGEKIAWILLVIFVSWFAWIFYMLLAPLSARRQS